MLEIVLLERIRIVYSSLARVIVRDEFLQRNRETVRVIEAFQLQLTESFHGVHSKCVTLLTQ